MAWLDKLTRKQKITADDKLSTGEINWKLKPEIYSVKEYPNFFKAIQKLENENNIQFGLHNDIVNDAQVTVTVRNTVYSIDGKPNFTFMFMCIRLNNVKGIGFAGYIADFYNVSELKNIKREYMVGLKSNKEGDLSEEEYEDFYWSLLNKSLSIRGFNASNYMIKRQGKHECIYKIMEKDIRKKYS